MPPKHVAAICQFFFELSYVLDVPSRSSNVRLKRRTNEVAWYEKWSVKNERWPLE